MISVPLAEARFSGISVWCSRMIRPSLNQFWQRGVFLFIIILFVTIFVNVKSLLSPSIAPNISIYLSIVDFIRYAS